MPRLRMFAGPNGSGKSTMKEVIAPKLLGVYVNADDIERSWRAAGQFDFAIYQVKAEADDVLGFFERSEFLRSAGLASSVEQLRYEHGCLVLDSTLINSYLASVLADYLRHSLLALQISFTFETVMSSPDKIEFLDKARRAGFRTYLYYVATEDPEINISRVAHRVKVGGHPVPAEKIVERYYRSLDLLSSAIQKCSRSFIFDNSAASDGTAHGHEYLAEITEGVELEYKTEHIPVWFDTYVVEKLAG